jgi:hypothetical protein
LRDDVKNRAIVNVVDRLTTWEEDWPEICEWLGMKGVGPRSGALTGKVSAWRTRAGRKGE